MQGRYRVTPDWRERGMAVAAWTQNPLLRRAVQAYPAAVKAATETLAGAELAGRDDGRLKFVLTSLIAAAAPSNNPLLNPAGLKAALDTGGVSVVRGVRALIQDLAEAPRVPAMVEQDAFAVGKDLAITKGSVVFRTEMFELIQYAPATEQVHEYPLLIVPPMINKYYITDLAPGRSMTEYLVGQGHQVYAISWRNPDARHSEWDLDAYGAAVVEAFDTALAISKAAKGSICALFSGGIVSSIVASHRAATGHLTRFPHDGLGQRADQARRRDDHGHARRLVQGRRRFLCGGGPDGPPVSVAVLLPQHPVAWRRGHVRPVHERAHRVHGEPPDQPEVVLPDGAQQCWQPGRSARLARRSADQRRKLVAALLLVAGSTQRPGSQGPP